MKFQKFLAKSLHKATDIVHGGLSFFVSEEKLASWKPIHLCWWYDELGEPTPDYFISTHITAPTVTTDTTPSNITGSSATFDSNSIDDTGGENASERGICWVQGSGGSPTTSDSVASETGSFSAGSFSATASGLSSDTTYSVRAYAINSAGTAYGSTVEVTTAATGPPAVILDSPSDSSTVSDTTPTLTFTGTDPDGDDIRYNIQIDTVNTFDSGSTIDAVSNVDTGFNDPDGSDTDPFTSGNQIEYTVQSELSLTTYYWRVRGLDPNHTNTYGSWSSTRSFTVSVDAVRNLVQYENDHETPIATGGAINSGTNPTLMYDVTTATDTESTTIVPYAEVELVGTSFDDTASSTGPTFHWNPDMWVGRRGAGIVYNPDMKAFIMSHGYDSTTYFEQTWILKEEGGQWKWREIQTQDSNGSPVTSYDGTQAPTGRYFNSLTWDSNYGHGILFGGYNGTDLNDTWRLFFYDSNDDTPEWWSISPSGSIPSARANIQESSCFDPNGAKTWIFGGWGASYYNDVYEFDSSSFNGTWTQLHSGSGTAPNPARNSSLIFDETNNRLIQFGGHNGTTANNQVWAFNLSNNTWTQLSPSGTAPAARELHNAAYDAVNQRMVIWGGSSNGTSGTYYRDAFELNLTSGSEAWNNISDATYNMPLSTVSATSAVDTDNNLFLVVGGTDETGDDWRREHVFDLNDTSDPIGFHGLNWNNKYRPLDAPAYAYNPDHDEFVITGGLQHMTDNTDPANGGHGTATHIYDVANNLWRNGVVGLTPFQREGSLMVYDTLRDRFVMFGGMQGNNGCLNDTWQLKRNTNGDYEWTKLNPTGTLPTRRWLMAGGYDAVNDRLVLWGGQDQGFSGSELGDTWELSFSSSADGAWTQRTPSGTGPTAASASAYAVDTTNNHLYIAGGATSGDGAYSTQFLQLDMSTTSMAWTSRTAFTTGRRSAVLTYDNTNGKLVLFGGWSGSEISGSQVFDITGNTWAALSPTGTAPDGRRSHAGFGKDNVHIFTGGRPGTGTWYNDTQELTVTTYNSSSAWANKNPAMYQKIALPQSGLADGNYHWQAWAGSSIKVSFGGNTEASTDFIIGSPTPQYTVTHTADSLKRKSNTASHSTDSKKKKTNTSSHTTSSNLVDEVWTYEDATTLPTTDNLLANSYNDTDRSAIATNDDVFKDLTGSGFLIEQGWVYHTNNVDEINLSWSGKTTLAPSASTVYLQIYNHNSSSWTTLDFDSATAADTEFTLSGSQTDNLSQYYDTDNRVAVRVYQGVI